MSFFFAVVVIVVVVVVVAQNVFSTQAIPFNNVLRFIMCVLQSHGQSEGFEKIMRNVNIVFTTLFTIESILKILGFGIKVS